MLSFQSKGGRLCDGFNRREWLRVGGLGVVGLSLTDLLRAERSTKTRPGPTSPLTDGLSGAMFGQAKNVIFLWLQGGPPQHETFDPKPEAPLEIRGPFKPIQTNIPGLQFCELLPRTAQRADKLAVIRSFCTDDNNHDVSGYWVLTGYPYGPGSARQIKPTDWPYMGSVIRKLKPSERLPALTSVWLPDMMRLNDNVTPAGQTGGFLGSMWDPERFIGDPAADKYHIEGLALPADLSADRMADRAALLAALNQTRAESERRAQAPGKESFGWNRLSEFAMDLVTSGKARDAFDLEREPAALRDRYGRHTWGQSCLLARRLIEAGVRLVHVNWPREPGDNAVDNPLWDTHAQNADRVQDVLCPIFDVTYAALLDDLEARGLLSETLVVAIGEFGRTPVINGQGGRDHWGSVFSGVLAGAGISGGQTFGASDRNGAYPIVDPIRPHDLTATIFHLLGIPHDGVFRDRTDRPQPLTKGSPLYRLLGAEPATTERCESTGNESLVPPWDPSLLVDTDFSLGKLIPANQITREKGWRCSPAGATIDNGLCVRSSILQSPHARVGVFSERGVSETVAETPTVIAKGARAVLAQEIRSARGGHYTMKVRISGQGSSQAAFEKWFHGGMTCRLVLYRYGSAAKNPLEISELASQAFVPQYTDFASPSEYMVSQFLGSTVPGSNFSIGNGLGIAIVVQCETEQQLPVGESAYLAVRSVQLDFSPRMRDETVTV